MCYILPNVGKKWYIRQNMIYYILPNVVFLIYLWQNIRIMNTIIGRMGRICLWHSNPLITKLYDASDRVKMIDFVNVKIWILHQDKSQIFFTSSLHIQCLYLRKRITVIWIFRIRHTETYSNGQSEKEFLLLIKSIHITSVVKCIVFLQYFLQFVNSSNNFH